MVLFKYSCRDWILALLIAVLVLVFGAMTLSAGLPFWGDDSAAYISEGLSIADGYFQKQTELNVILHPANLPAEVGSENLVYAWGYPLLLSTIYKLVGFDKVNYSSIIWYKIPLLLSLSSLGGVLYLFYRRRFSAGVSFVSASVLCFSSDLVKNLNYLYSDLLFLFFSTLTLLIMESYREKALSAETRKSAGNILFAVLYGAVLWYADEIRLNGFTVCMIAAAGHAVFLWRNRDRISRRKLWLHVFPYAVMFGLILISEHLFLASATSNLSVVGKASDHLVRDHLFVYSSLILDFFNSLPGINMKYTAYFFSLACLIGMVKKSMLENEHLTLLLVGTLIVTVSITYYQGLRYLYNILPILVMFTVYGIQAVWHLVIRIISIPRKLWSVFKICAAIALLCLPILRTVIIGVDNLKHWGQLDGSDVYSDEAIDMYRFIQENIPEDKVIAFGKPRSLYLNTDRVSFRTGFNGHTIAGADYYLEYHTDNTQFSREISEAAVTPKKPIYTNGLYTLYWVSKDGDDP